AEQAGGFAPRCAHVDEQTSGVTGHRQVLSDLSDDDCTDGSGIDISLHEDGGPLLPPDAGRVRKPDEDHVAPAHDYSGMSSYTSISSHPACLPASQARACNSSLVHGLSSYSCSLRRSYSSTRSRTNVSLVRGFTMRGGLASGCSRACACCSVNSIIAAS